MRYLVVVHQDQPTGPCGVTVPDLPGCFSAGATLADALEQAREAIALHVEGCCRMVNACPRRQCRSTLTGASWRPSRSMTGCCLNARCG